MDISIILGIIGVAVIVFYIFTMLDLLEKNKKLIDKTEVTNRYLKYLAFLISQQTPPDLSVEEPDFLNPKSSDAKNQKE